MVKSISEASTRAIVDLRATPKQITKVLLVDDDIGFLKVSRSCLEQQAPFEVDTASSVEEAIRKIGEHEYDAVISDWHMPGKDGLEFLKELREKGNAIPFIMFTGKGREEIAIRALNLGADQYLNKTGDSETVYFELAHAIRKTVERKHAKEAFRESEDRFRTITQRSFDIILTLNPEGKITYVSQAAKTVGGYEPQEIIGKPFSRFLHESESSDGAAFLQRILAGEDAERQELTFLRKDGTAATLEVNAFPVMKDGKIVEIRATTRDITERKRYETELRRLASFPEANPHPVLEIDLTGKITYLNPSARKLILRLRDSKLPNGFEEDFKAIISEFNIRRSQSFLRENANIGDRFYQQTIRYVPEKAALRLYMLDITERTKTEQTLRASLERYRSFIEVTGELGWTTNAEGEIVEDTPSFREFTGLTYEEIRGWGWSKAIHPDDLERTTQIWKEATTTKSKYEVEYRLRRRDGVYRHFMARGAPVFKEDGNIEEWVGTCIDITERKRTEEELLQQKERAEKYLNIVGNVIVSLDSRGKITLLNKKGYEVLGYREGELVGKGWFETCLPEENREETRKVFEACIQGKAELTEHHENPILTRNGEKRTVSWQNTILKDENGKIIGTLSSGDDITESRKARDALGRSEERARNLLEFQSKVIDTAVVWINLLDGDGNVTLWNRAAELISGYSREEVIGHDKVWEWLYPHPQYCAKVFAEARNTIEHKETAMQNFETVIRCKNGALKTIAWYANSISDEKGKPVGGITVGLDVSQLKKAERELHEAMQKLELINEKLRVVGGLTRHDVRNKLAVVTGNAYLARKTLPQNSEILDYLNQIEASVKQTVKILEFSRAYEMLGVEELVHVDVEKTVNEAISLFSGSKDVEITDDCHGLTVLADSLLGTLFYNLIDNSLKYGEKLSRIRVYYEKKNGDCLNVIYEDDGVGIPQATKAKLFTEGYTTGKGSGYGLYLIKKMIEAYGWTIREMGEPGKGAKFVMQIPERNASGKKNYRITY